MHRVNHVVCCVLWVMSHYLANACDGQSNHVVNGGAEPAGVLLAQPTYDLSPIPAKTHTGEEQEKWINLSRAELVGEVLGEACRTKAALFILCRHILCRISFFVYNLFSPFFQLHYHKLKSILKGLAQEQVVIVTVEREQSVTG